MIFSVYTRPDGAYVLVPDCLRVPRSAEALHGPLEYCDSIDSEAHPLPALWERVLDEIDQMSYAVLQAAIGRQMLGLDCETDSRPPATASGAPQPAW